MTDDRLRRHERDALRGDPGAAGALEHERARSGVPVCNVSHTPRPLRVCAHLLPARPQDAYVIQFTGRGVEQRLLCQECTPEGAPLVDTCAACVRAIEVASYPARHVGTPQVLERTTSLRLEPVTAPVAPPLVDLAPVRDGGWLALGEDGRLHRLDLARGEVVASAPGLEHTPTGPHRLRASARGDLVAIVERRGQRGVVLDATTGEVLLPLDRGDYHPEQSEFPLAFLERGGQTLVVHGVDWNRLEVTDPRTGARPADAPVAGEARESSRPGRPGDHFRGHLVPSPDGAWLAEDGWIWQPVGCVLAWPVEPWLGEGTTDRFLLQREDWDLPLCWVGPRTLAVYGFGDVWNDVLPAAVIFDVTTGERARWFAGPDGGDFFFVDPYLLATGGGATSLWDVATGERVLRVEGWEATHVHPCGQLVRLANGALTVMQIMGM